MSAKSHAASGLGLKPFDIEYSNLLRLEYADLVVKHGTFANLPNPLNFHPKILGVESLRKILGVYSMSNLFLMHITDFKNFKNLIPYEEFNISNYQHGRIGLSLFYNKALIDESYGAIETYFRILGTWIFNDYSYFRGKKFHKVRKDILLYLKLEKYNPLFEIFDIIRNGIHTDMIYTSESSDNIKIVRYKFNFYFVKHRPIRYIEHDYLFFILAEISFLMDDILNHDWIKLRDFKENDLPHW